MYSPLQTRLDHQQLGTHYSEAQLSFTPRQMDFYSRRSLTEEDGQACRHEVTMQDEAAG